MGFGDFMAKVADKVEDIVDDLKPLSLEEQREIGVRGLRDALKWALGKALEWGMDERSWLEDRVKLRVPGLQRVMALDEKLNSIPAVGPAMSRELWEEVGKVEDELRDGAVATSSDHHTRDCFVDAITSASPSNILDIIREGGMTGFVDYLKHAAEALLKSVLRPFVKDAIDDRAVTKSWIKFQELFNRFATRVGIEPLTTDLVDYVVERSVSAILLIMSDREKELRAAPHAAASAAVQQILSGVDPSNWKRLRN